MKIAPFQLFRMLRSDYDADMEIEAVLNCYLTAKALDNRTSERDRYSLAHLRPYFGGRRVCDIKRAHVRAYITGRLSSGVKVSTVQRELRLMCAAINFARLEYDLDLPNPAACLGLSAAEPRVRWITRAEAARLIAAAEQCPRPHLAVFVRLALNTGCRRGELLGLEWSRVDVARRQILLEARHTKTRKRRTVPLNDDALAALDRLRQWQARHLPGTPWVFGWRDGERIKCFKVGWKTALERAAIENFRIHDLRHTVASWLVQQGESLYTVRDLLGHASIRQTEIYAHLAPNQAAAAVQRLLPF